MNIYFLAIADIVFNNVCFCLGDHAAVLPLNVTLSFIIVAICAYKKRVIACNSEPRECAGLSFAGTRVDDLDDLIESDRSGVYLCKARQDRRYADCRE